jgi:hypothetical protein
MSDQPELRNLAITQCYSDLSQSLRIFSGRPNTNWCTYATWASKTVGQFIRLDRFTEHADAAFSDSTTHRDWWQESIERKFNGLPHADEKPHTIRDLLKDILDDVSSNIAAGNLKVFAELGPLFADMLETFGDVGYPSRSEVDAFTARLEPGSTADGGQDLLRSAIEHFIEARPETDPRRKAQLILLANTETGLHEQIRLQPYIANSMDAAVVDAFDRFHSISLSIRPMKRVAHRALQPKTAKWLTHAFETANTRLYATAHLPTGKIHLGKPIPTPAGQNPYPDDLMEIELSELTSLLHRYNSLKPSSKEVPTHDWADLDERMHFIVQLFRSRQQDAVLYSEPFTAEQRAKIHAGVIPDGQL